MAIFAAVDVRVEINAVDLSDHVVSAEIPQVPELLDKTVMGDTTRRRIKGLDDWTLNVEFLQDFAAAKVDATLNGILGTAVTVKIRPTSAAISATNPEYSGSGFLANYDPISGTIGEVAKTTVAFQCDGPLTRATS
ncbi:MAG: radical SAM protein [bacterium]|nr:radical SAM protein [bacterium]